MSRINTNVSSMLAQRVLKQQNQGLSTSLERLSTGLRINRGADDPAGLIASENLRAEKTAITSAIGNAERASQVVNIAEGGLTEVSALLQDLEGLVGKSANDAGLSQEEKEANQLEVDSILRTIDRIANSTSFQGQKLLNGDLAYDTSGVDNTKIADLQVNSARVPDGGLNATVELNAAAEKGKAFLATTAGVLDDGTVDDKSLTIEVKGEKGTQQFTFAEGSTIADITSAVNSFSEVTGVKATDDDGSSGTGTHVQFATTEYGSDQAVSVSIVGTAGGYAGDISATGGTAAGAGVDSAEDSGLDADVTINGQQAQTDGLNARVASAGLDLSVSLTESLNTTGTGTETFKIDGGGATFQLSAEVGLNGQGNLGIQSVTTAGLGSAAAGQLSELGSGGAATVVDGDTAKAQDVVRASLKQVAGLRGRIGAFQKNEVQATIRSLGVALENTSAAESQIRDTDFAKETAELTRKQIMVQAATNVLGVANSSPQNVLALLG